MNLQSRMQLHVLVYKIVSLRMAYGHYVDSQETRSKLEEETHKVIRRRAQLDLKTQLESAQSLHDSYSEKVSSRSDPLTWALQNRGKPFPVYRELLTQGP